MTSNVGARDLASSPIGFSSETRLGSNDREFNRVFSPEFRNRLDARIRFAALKQEVMERIVVKFIDELSLQLADRRVSVTVDEAAREYLGKEGFDPLMGARPLARVIVEQVKRPLSEEILFGGLEHGGEATVTIKDGAIAFDIVSYDPEPEPEPELEPESTESEAEAEQSNDDEAASEAAEATDADTDASDEGDQE